MATVANRAWMAAFCVAVLAGSTLAWQPAETSRPADNRQPGQPGGERPRREGGPREGGREGRAPSVEGAMKSVGRAMEALQKSIKDPAKHDENLRLINDMQRGCVAAKGMPVPEDFLKKAAMPADKAKISAYYREHLIASLKLMIEIEEDLMAGKNDAAAAKLEKLNEGRIAAHKEMGVKDD